MGSQFTTELLDRTFGYSLGGVELPTVTFLRGFSSLEGFSLAAAELPAASLRAPLNADGGKHRIASVGGDVAGPAVPLSDGGSLREGFVPVAEQQRVGGTP